MSNEWRDGLITFEQILEEDLKDPEFRAEWERTALARAVANEVVRYRIEHGLTQWSSWWTSHPPVTGRSWSARS